MTRGILCAVLLAVLPVAGKCSDCPPQGDATRTRELTLNRLKNRTAEPVKFDHSITLAKMLTPGDDTHRFTADQAARITGYVVEVKPGGQESCNCHAKDLALRDTHIALALSAEQGKSNRNVIVVEVTPHVRANHPTLTTAQIKTRCLHKMITVHGFMFFDAEHAGQSEHTNPGAPHNWRASAWEIHPAVVENL